MGADKTELRGLCPVDLAEALDAIAMAKGMDRNSYVIHVLSSEVRRYIDEASLALQVLQRNPLVMERDGRGRG